MATQLQDAQTTTSTSISLSSLPQPRHHTHGVAAAEPSSPSASAQDPILTASQLADSAVPDGGKQPWTIVAACAVCAWWFVGTPYCWGEFQAQLVHDGLAGPSTLSFVASLCTALLAALAVANARVVRWLGAQRAAVLGIVLVGGSEILSGWSVRSVGGLFVTSGVVMGLGIGLCFMVCSVVPAQYFNKKRGLANGIVFAGGGLGGAATSLALDAVIQRVGVEWAFRALGLATIVTGVPAAWLIKERAPIRTTSFVEWQLVKDLRFVIIFLAGAIGTFPLLVPPFFIPLYAQSIGLSNSTGAALLAGFNFSSFVGRVSCGLLCDRLGAVTTLLIAMLLSSVSMLVIWPASTTLGPMVLFVLVNGAANGGFFSCMPTVVGNVFGSARVSVAMGMVVTGWVGGYLMGAPIAGYLLEAYGGKDGGLLAYRPAMFYAGSMALASAVLVAAVRVHITRSILVRV